MRIFNDGFDTSLEMILDTGIVRFIHSNADVSGQDPQANLLADRQALVWYPNKAAGEFNLRQVPMSVALRHCASEQNACVFSRNGWAFDPRQHVLRRAASLD